MISGIIIGRMGDRGVRADAGAGLVIRPNVVLKEIDR